MLRTHTEKVLNDFAESVFDEARKNLQGKNVSKELVNSFKFKVKESKNSIQLNMEMAEHGFYQDEGVRGVGGVRKTTSRFNKRNNKGKLWKQNGKGSRFNFFRGPSVKHIVA